MQTIVISSLISRIQAFCLVTQVEITTLGESLGEVKELGDLDEVTEAGESGPESERLSSTEGVSHALLSHR